MGSQASTDDETLDEWGPPPDPEETVGYGQPPLQLIHEDEKLPPMS